MWWWSVDLCVCVIEFSDAVKEKWRRMMVITSRSGWWMHEEEYEARVELFGCVYSRKRCTWAYVGMSGDLAWWGSWACPN
ncbi:hypothetical protein QYF36_025228 [Acer negundo]|nr:hypothetical protein QYF36_025228 [Acer negundo]